MVFLKLMFLIMTWLLIEHKLAKMSKCITSYSFVFLLFLTVTVHAFDVIAQQISTQIVDRNYIPDNLILDTSYLDKKEDMVQIYFDSLNKERLIKTTYKTGEIDWTLFKFKQNSSVNYFFNSQGVLLNFLNCMDNIKINQQYAENGVLKKYQFLQEDTVVGQFGFQSNSYRIHFNDNGTIRSLIYFTNKKEAYQEFSPEGKVVLRSTLFTASNLDIYYIGKYTTYSNKGEILERGKYYVQDKNALVKVQLKEGVWKYYSDGILTKKEKYNKEGLLFRTKVYQ